MIARAVSYAPHAPFSGRGRFDARHRKSSKVSRAFEEDSSPPYYSTLADSRAAVVVRSRLTHLIQPCSSRLTGIRASSIGQFSLSSITTPLSSQEFAQFAHPAELNGILADGSEADLTSLLAPTAAMSDCPIAVPQLLRW
jgi:hypothetical protein